jgi:hypothetical protein
MVPKSENGIQEGKIFFKLRFNTKIFQLYVIQGRYRGRIVTLGFAIMKRRRRASYVLLFEALAARYLALTGRALSPRLVVTDYEVKLAFEIL